ncbi:MAG: proteasome subunit alpha, partial [Nitrospiraceae bacterium]|nr:proteasome subunit alpha [Nitrospiraceae bacterium]
FYDILGAHFEGVEFSVGGSGSPEVQGILRFLDRWGEKSLRSLTRDEALLLSLRLLETASYFDSATGGVGGQDPIYPVIRILTPHSLDTVADEQIAALYRSEVMRVR